MIYILIAAGLLIWPLALWKPFPQSRGRFRATLAFVLLWAVARSVDHYVAPFAALALLELAGLEATAGTALGILMARVSHPRFKVEVFVVFGYVAIVGHLLFQLGVNVTGIFATSAVATAVVGLALQDMLSNIAGGLALELEREIRVGDFIKCNDTAGWVEHVRLRHTALETPDGDRVILPNSFLVRQSVIIISQARRRFIPFMLPYAYDPQDVIDAVTQALRMSPIMGVTAEPAASCVVQELAAGHVGYAAVVWLTEPGRESLMISEVLNRVWFALRRAGVPVSEISTLVELKPPEPKQSKAGSHAHDVLRATPIFRLLDDESIEELGSQMKPLCYAPGEYIMRQNQAGDSMYFVIAGQAAITIEGEDNTARQVAVIPAGDFFGEASLLTGAARNASAIAISRLDCYRLDKAGLQGLMRRRPELAEDMAVVIAHRQMELDGVRQELDLATARLRETQKQTEVLDHIRRFFGLS
jgi:small-conductance mechanosensitive channel/CRP-like cAMP-binding protein